MKNQFKITLFALGALALGACTDNDVVSTGNPVINGAGGDSYISLAINLPTTPSTRAANDVYDDGLESEYAVNDATLILFNGTSEANAVVSQIINLGNWSGTLNPADDNITSRKQFTEQIQSVANNLYALVVVNGTGVISGMNPPVSLTEGTTFASLQTQAVSMDVATIANASSANFYMTNAPLWNGTSGGYTSPTGEVTTLTYIDASKIYDTQAEAEENPATEIYVERGVAKVTVDGTNTLTTLPEGFTTATVNGFVLDLTNLTGYPVRNSQTAATDALGASWWTLKSGKSDVISPYRMVGSTAVGTNLYRTYWATDPNYGDPMYTGGTSGNRTYPETVSSLDGTAPTGTQLTAADGVTGAYCLENTFTVAHQNQDETTRAIVAVTLGNGEDFYTFEGEKSTTYTASAMADKVLSIYAANGLVEQALETWIGGTFDFATIYEVTLGTTTQAGSRDIDISITYASEGVQLTGEQFSDGVVPAVLNPNDNAGAFQAIVDAINADHEFSYYAGGVAYYPVLIKHFGDELTPWTADEVALEEGDETVSDNSASYPENINGASSEANWLGRYGVLRNNWYDIQVTGVSEIGSADVPTAYDEPDDPMYHWISVEINILSWAKRTQSVTL